MDELFVLNDRWRVSTRDPLQWMLQYRSGQTWKPLSFCVTKEALLRCIREKCGDVDVDVVSLIRDTFPDWHPDRCAEATKTPALPPIPPEPVYDSHGLSYGVSSDSWR